ncbi:MAG TPA: hypothetical protein VGO47_03285, partial [Chlamydiales bacterium]|nr:hypothetical protein [Chlamydiales bacterium]
MSSPVSVSSLRNHLLTSLTDLPGSRTFHIHVLVSTSRKPSEPLFPYAAQKPKCVEQNVLVLLSEDTSNSEGQVKEGVATSNSSNATGMPRSFVTAVEATVYEFPVSQSTILYISKVDGTGQGMYPSPTSTLVKSFLE